MKVNGYFLFSVMPISPPKRITPNDVGINHRNNSRLQVTSSVTKATPQILATLEEIRSPDLQIALPAITLMSDILRLPEGNAMIAYEDEFFTAALEQIKLTSKLSFHNQETWRVYRRCFNLLIAVSILKVLYAINEFDRGQQI